MLAASSDTCVTVCEMPKPETRNPVFATVTLPDSGLRTRTRSRSLTRRDAAPAGEYMEV